MTIKTLRTSIDRLENELANLAHDRKLNETASKERLQLLKEAGDLLRKASHTLDESLTK